MCFVHLLCCKASAFVICAKRITYLLNPANGANLLGILPWGYTCTLCNPIWIRICMLTSGCDGVSEMGDAHHSVRALL